MTPDDTKIFINKDFDVDLETIERHPYSALYPNLEGEALWALRRSVQSDGVREPIVIYNNQVLDGWQRLEAARFCDKVESAPFRVFEGTDAEALALVTRAHTRRDMTESQKAAAAVGVLMHANKGNTRAMTQEQAAGILGVSRGYVAQLAAAVKEDPENAVGLVQDVLHGRKKVSDITTKRRVKKKTENDKRKSEGFRKRIATKTAEQQQAEWKKAMDQTAKAFEEMLAVKLPEELELYIEDYGETFMASVLQRSGLHEPFAGLVYKLNQLFELGKNLSPDDDPLAFLDEKKEGGKKR